MPPKKSIYQKKDQISHVLDRSDLWVGSTRPKNSEEFIVIKDKNGDFKIIKKIINYPPAFLRIFIEALSNAIDNYQRSNKTKTPSKMIKININEDTGETSVWNDGQAIPIEIHPEEKMYNHTLIFGHLLSGSNYDDTEQRDVSGRNGIGIKATSIFSKKFTVFGLDSASKKTFSQTWKNNMREVEDPIIKDTKLNDNFTKVTYFPEFERFGLEGYTSDIISLFLKYIIDASMLMNTVDVYFNEELIPVKDLESYSQLYETSTNDSLLIKNKNCEVLVCPANINEFQAISFVNGVYTKLGGVHVDTCSEAIFRPLVEKFNKKDKPQVNIKDIKQFFRIFIVCTLPNPEFSSQEKDKLESPKLNFEIKQADINKILKWNVIEEINDIIKMKEMVVLKKSEKKKKGYTKIEGLDPANNAGGKLGYQCSLIVCEGLSAKTFAVAGIKKGVYDKAGRDWFGCLPLRGKCIALDTPILLWNGQIKKAQDIKVGDILVNDMGEQTTVLELFSGTDTMYEVQQLKGDNYTVNSEHTLTLKVSGNCSITWLDKKNCWNMEYFDRDTMKIKNKQIFCSNENGECEQEICEVVDCKDYQKSFCDRSSLTRHYNRKHKDLEYPKPKKSIVCYNSTKSKDEGYIEILEFQKTINDDNIVDIDIKEYLKLDDRVKHLLKGFKLNNYIKWDKKDVLLDPYILGMWLGDGLASGYGFAGEDIELINEWRLWCIKNNCEIVHNNRDSFTIRKKDSLKLGGKAKKINIGSSNSSNKNCRACSDKVSESCSNDKELAELNKNRTIQIIDYDNKEVYGSNPLREALKKYNLIDNKHIPIDYIINDKETRLKLLAGFIDTDGYVGKCGRIEICQSKDRKNMLDSLLLICRSLGFYCYINEKKASYIDKDGKKIYKEAYRLSVSGNGISEIPTKLPRKKLEHVFVKDSLNTGINIVEKGQGEYVGFMTDKTHRFLLGDFTVTHNCLNVRNSIPTTIAKNKVITDLIQALNLRHDLDYTDDKNYKTLSYGKVILLTDADCDGLHISGLVMNFIHYLFPSILERKDPYIISMCTPIVRVFNKGNDLLFYDENRYKQYEKEQLEKNKTFKSKYYKGLGTTKPEDVPDIFGSKLIEYNNDEYSNSNMNKVFHKKFADTRKEWLENYEINQDFSLDDQGKIVNMDISDFLNNEVIKFSHNDCKRSIPSLFDGLKESQRKVFYAIKKKNLTYNKTSLKVAQLGGYVAEHSNYHHGEQNLYDTIVKMAQDFVGSNNIPLLYRDGMFGTRMSLGKDSASARYIFTKMESITPLIFREEDDILLDYVIDDGDIVEPKFYIPILPMILINGCIGIGTGYSSSIPSYNPLDIIECIKIWLDNDGEVLIKDPDDGVTLSMFPDIHPWYRGFKGTVEKCDNKYITYGLINKNKDKVEITEIPINMSIDNFKEKLEDLMVNKTIKNMKNYSSPNEVNFLVTESDDGILCSLDNLGLYSYIHTTNMVLFNEKEQLKKYTVDQILNEFCKMRYSYYEKRKKHIIVSLEKELKFLGNKERFITEIVNKKLNVMNVDEDVLIAELEKKGYDKFNKTEDVNDDESDTKNGYNYLLKLPVRTLTANQIQKIKNDILSLKTKLKNTINTTEKNMWLNELKEFEIEYEKWLKNISKNGTSKTSKKIVLKKK